MRSKAYLIMALISAICGTGLVSSILLGSTNGNSDQQLIDRLRREPLAGLQGVHVLVEDFGPVEKKYGLTKQAFQTDVELRLRQYGVRVLSREESLQTVGDPCLYVVVTVQGNERLGICAGSVRVALQEVTLLQRNPETAVPATTWDKGAVWLGGSSYLNKLRQVVIDRVDMFINDYLAANPKKTPIRLDDFVPVESEEQATDKTNEN